MLGDNMEGETTDTAQQYISLTPALETGDTHMLASDWSARSYGGLWLVIRVTWEVEGAYKLCLSG